MKRRSGLWKGRKPRPDLSRKEFLKELEAISKHES
jgi:hypothetical protein